MTDASQKHPEVDLPSCRPAVEQTTLELINLFGQIAARANRYDTEEMHNRYWEIRRELEARIIDNNLLSNAPEMQ